jgi:hypothetical protein
MEPLIFFIFEKSIFLLFMPEESSKRELQFHSNLTQTVSIISKIVKTSNIFGTLFNFTFHFKNKLAPKIGRVAFLEPLM